MKEWLSKRKIILAICIVIIIAGLIMLFTKGFKKEAYYTKNQKIEMYIEKGYEKDTIMNIAKESFENKEISLEEIEKLEQVAAIRVKNPTEEEIENFENKIKENYGIEDDNFEVYNIDMPSSKITTFIQPYIFPITLVTILYVIYVCIINIKSKKIIENVIIALLKLILVEGVYFSLILIFRLPFGTYTMPISLTLYLTTLLISSNSLKK